MTLGNAARAGVRLIVWCKTCLNHVEPDPAEQARRYGADTAVPEWRERLVCWACGNPDIDMVVTGTERRKGARLAEDPREALYEASAGRDAEQHGPGHLLAGRRLLKTLREPFDRNRVHRNSAWRLERRRGR
jgi:hypothetical protein